MSKEARLAMALSIGPENAGSTPILKTDNGLRLEVPNAELLARLQEFSKARELFTIFYDPQSNVATSALLPPTDTLKALGPPATSDGEVMVHLLMSPRLFYLNKTHPRFDDLYSLLERALREKGQVSLAVFAGSDKVQDVRIVP